MINVLSVVPYQVLPAKFGGQKGIALFNKYFAKQVNLVCVTTKKNDPAAAEGYEVLNILSDSSSRYINLFYFFKLRKIIRQKQVSHLLIEHPYYGWLGIMLKKFTGVKLIVHSHNIEGLRWKGLKKWWWKILLSYEGITHRNADYNFFIQQQDADYAIKQFHLKPAACLTVTYGTEISASPAPAEKEKARKYLQQQHNIPAHHHILLFNGTFNYYPNLEALQNIITGINPILQQNPDFHYSIIICGRNIPENISHGAYPNMIIAGLVDDIEIYFRGANIFLNPVINGGGIKTKLIEALANGTSAVSTHHGAIGIEPQLCNGKLVITANGDWKGFVQAVINMADTVHAVTPAGFFEFFYWGNIVKRVKDFIEKK